VQRAGIDSGSLFPGPYSAGLKHFGPSAVQLPIMAAPHSALQQIADRQREQILRRYDRWFEMPMVLLGFVWLILLMIELVWGLSPLLTSVGTVIWILFIADFGIRFVLAPRKARFLRANWITALALALPALRVFRVFRAFRLLRAARAARGLRLIRLLTSLNRGMRALGASMHRRGFGYVLLLTVLVMVAGAAGMYALEGPERMGSYPDALWWTAMIMTTMGSETWPQTGEGRVLCLVLALYAFTVFGYTTASLATFFIGRDAEDRKSEIAGAAELRAIRGELQALRRELRRLAADTGRLDIDSPRA
jgi:voltage-gated potassium channel